MTRQLLALTLWQPWAWAIAHAGKTVENRTWQPPRSVIGSHLAIHAGKTLDRDAIEDLELDGHAVPPLLERGAIVAVARVVGWVRCEALLHRTAESFAGVTRARAELAVQSPWWAGPVGWVLDDVVAIAPIAIGGAQGLWPVPGTVADAVRDRWREARR